jgi:hypothetical protein
MHTHQPSVKTALYTVVSSDVEGAAGAVGLSQSTCIGIAGDADANSRLRNKRGSSRRMAWHWRERCDRWLSMQPIGLHSATSDHVDARASPTCTIAQHATMHNAAKLCAHHHASCIPPSSMHITMRHAPVVRTASCAVANAATAWLLKPTTPPSMQAAD